MVMSTFQPISPGNDRAVYVQPSGTGGKVPGRVTGGGGGGGQCQKPEARQYTDLRTQRMSTHRYICLPYILLPSKCPRDQVEERLLTYSLYFEFILNCVCGL